jgi:DNA-binding transcriptional MerR regulator
LILSPRAAANGPMEKGPEAYRTIREVADSLDLPQHVLRFWETRFPQIRPLKRAGGRRYYRPDDIERLKIIKRLLYEEGYTIKGVQKLFKEQGVQALSAVALPVLETSLEAASAVEPPAVGSGQGTGVRESRPGLADDEIAVLRGALAALKEAGRILEQSCSSSS